jgi:glyoxylase-like metal-dependent hydrolase (beta-lactamase superfamily II)
VHKSNRQVTTTIRKFLTAFFLIALVSLSVSALAQEASVTQLAPDVYHFRYGFHSNIFVVTDEGVIATDPLSPAAARACLVEIRKITDQPVRYVIYSHDHTDHIAGGGVYQGEAQYVAHRNALALIKARGIDEIIVPDLLVGDRHTIELGGKKIQLTHLGRVESASGLAIYIPDDKILMWVDAVRSFGTPYRYLEGYDWLDFRNALKEVQTWDIEILVPGHGPPTNRNRLVLFANYLQDMQKIAEEEMTAYTQGEHSSKIGRVNPEKYFDSYISEIARRVSERMRPEYGDMGGYDDWGTKNAERAVVFLLHEILFFE